MVRPFEIALNRVHAVSKLRSFKIMQFEESSGGTPDNRTRI